ncbi:uncharacterized protein KY384_001854 [Bacidia gigantensis]|uniref:uncharacterized protein n=1 Tax=Bacidia gigantensis TaxID=2732470 RepID=UPI001D049BDC|nr:uncharacterized protein KY384_001854 [Bacidia gigantensis]KAG8533071.1 hypothetical protein KY384_001854 [Bacidia gigantensis]
MAPKTILLTGANGFVAGHILNVLLDAGYNVLGTVRSTSSAEKVKVTHGRYGDKLSFALVPDIEAPGAFDEVIKNVDGVIHSASPFHYPVEDNEKQLFQPAVNGTLRMLEAVHASGNERIKRVVMTSSFAAVLDTTKGLNPGRVYTEADWNPMTWDQAKVADGSAAYCASKSFAEKAAWEFVEKHKPAFSVVALCPPMVYGPPVHLVESMEKLNTSSKVIWNLINGSQSTVPPTSFPAFAYVPDLALSHLAALERPEAANKRYIITNGPYINEWLCDFIETKFPQLKGKVPKRDSDKPLPEFFRVDNARATKELGMKWTSFEDAFGNAVQSLLDLEKKLAE